MQKKEIYLAGGCFWGMQAYFDQLHGVISTEVGYANGKTEKPTYEMVCRQDTGFAETLKICYDGDILSLSFLLSLYFDVIDPTSYHRQGNDIGDQYRTGIYYVVEKDAAIAEASLQQLAKHYDEDIVVECMPLVNYYPAEMYHQKYLEKNPQGYCHIAKEKIQALKQVQPQKD